MTGWWVTSSSHTVSTKQSAETPMSEPAGGKAAFAAISRASLSPISGLCLEISALRRFRGASLRWQKSRSWQQVVGGPL
jgi:hypothetical protein